MILINLVINVYLNTEVDNKQKKSLRFTLLVYCHNTILYSKHIKVFIHKYLYKYIKNLLSESRVLHQLNMSIKQIKITVEFNILKACRN